MPKLLTIDDIRTLVNTVGIERFFLESIEYLKEDFARWQDFKAEPRQVIHYPHGVMELMPTATDDFYAMKFVNGHPMNPAANKATVVALGLYAEVKHGYPLLLSEMTILTALRTAATSALAAKYLAKAGKKTMALIGTGAQSEFQALAMHYYAEVDTIAFYDLDAKAMDKFQKNLAQFPIKLIPVSSIEAALTQADIITTATANKTQAKILKRDNIKPGVHINGIGGDCSGKTELEKDILQQCKIVVEHTPQTMIEGEIQVQDEKQIHAELWEIVQGKKTGREFLDEITLFDSVGFAIEDFSVLRYVYEKAVAHNIGKEVDMIPTGDPKDLFTHLLNH